MTTSAVVDEDAFTTVSRQPSEVIPDFDDLPHFLRPKMVSRIFGVSALTISRWYRNGTFPPPVRLGPKVIAWPKTQIAAHIFHLIDEQQSELASAKPSTIQEDERSTMRRAMAETLTRSEETQNRGMHSTAERSRDGR